MKPIILFHKKGIVLLHGIPGTGKTSYIRHLIGVVNTDVSHIASFGKTKLAISKLNHMR